MNTNAADFANSFKADFTGTDAFLKSNPMSDVDVAKVFRIGKGEITSELRATALFRVATFLDDPRLCAPTPPSGPSRREIMMVTRCAFLLW